MRAVFSYLLLAGLAWVAVRAVSREDLARLGGFLLRQPGWTIAAAAAYAGAFALRTLAWQVLLTGGPAPEAPGPPGPGASGEPAPAAAPARSAAPAPALPFRTLWRLNLAANLANHLAPGKLGEVARIGLAERQGLPRGVAVASVVQVRLIDTVALLAVAAPALVLSLDGLPGAPRPGMSPAGMAPLPAAAPPVPAARPWQGWALAAALAAVGGIAVLAAARRWGPRVARRWHRLAPLALALAGVPGRRLAVAWWLSAASWPLEAGILAVVARGLGVALDPLALVAVTLVAVAGQVIALTPGGLGTYEANMTAILQLYGVPPATALQMALFTHLAKYVFAVAAGLEPAWRLAGSPARLLGRPRE